MLTREQVDRFRRDGVLVVEDAVDPGLLARMRADFAAWVDESRGQSNAYGTTINGLARFHIESDHDAQRPKLLRVNAPVEVSDAYLEAMRDSRMTDSVAQLIGPDLKFHHSKINSKQPGGGTEVKWHQDFAFTPHSNDDVVTALLMIDDVTEDNGPLEVLPGSHRGPIQSLWHEGLFTGAIDEREAARCRRDAVLCTGRAGSVCLMHTRLLHGSAANRSPRPRTLFICVYSADDAVPLSPNPMPSRFEGELLRGRRSGRVRSVPFELELPQLPRTGSFFDQQAAPTG